MDGRESPPRVQGSDGRVGAVGGYTLKVVREATGRTQADLAEHLSVDLATIQGWESGRRPLSALRAADLGALHAGLISAGVDPSSYTVLRDAIDADVLLETVIRSDGRELPAGRHPLSLWVNQRDFINLVTWPFTGQTPDRLQPSVLPPRTSRRGPTPVRPSLTETQKDRFFDNLRAAAEQPVGTWATTEECRRLLQRQSVYLLGFDSRPATQEWLAEHRRSTLREGVSVGGMSTWAMSRSSAIALARHGDRSSPRTWCFAASA